MPHDPSVICGVRVLHVIIIQNCHSEQGYLKKHGTFLNNLYNICMIKVSLRGSLAYFIHLSKSMIFILSEWYSWYIHLNSNLSQTKFTFKCMANLIKWTSNMYTIFLHIVQSIFPVFETLHFDADCI